MVDIFDSLIAGNPASSFASNMPVPVALQADRPFGLNLAEAGGKKININCREVDNSIIMNCQEGKCHWSGFFKFSE